MMKYLTIKVTTICFLFIIFQELHVVAVGKAIQNKNITKELIVRRGLPNFFNKTLQFDSIKVAYLGGSITQQDGWRVYSLNWLKKRFPKATFTEINAAIGGTGSDFSVFRLCNYMLMFNPDIVFVEFVVNYSNSPSEKKSPFNGRNSKADLAIQSQGTDNRDFWAKSRRQK